MNPQTAVLLRNALLFLITSLLALLIAPTFVLAATYYWDANGPTAGAGTTPSGSWGVDPYWTTSSTGVTTTANAPTNSFDTLTFSAGTDAIGSPTINLNGTQNAQLLSVQEGAPSFSGGTINLTASGGTSSLAGGITVAAAAGNPTISSNLTINGHQVFNVDSGRTLTLNTGSFTRGNGATFNAPVTTANIMATMTNLSSADLVNGIIGPWATIGTDSRYATINGSNQITAHTGISATTLTMKDTTGTVNYELSGSGNVATFSANTIRVASVSGAVMLLVNPISVNGLNAGNGGLTISGAMNVDIGANRELVVVAGEPVIIASVIQDNAAGASGLTKAGALSLILSAPNTYTGTTTINQGSFIIDRNGSLADTGAVVLNGGGFSLNITAASETIGSIASLPGTSIFLSSKNLTTGGNNNSTTVAGTIFGTSGSLTKAGTGTMTLTGVNTYTGATTVRAGTLLANNTAGSATGTGNILVNRGTFGGTGAVTGSVSVAGISGSDATLSPGESTESLDVGGLSVAGIYSHFDVEVDLDSTTRAADLLNVRGTVSLNLARLDLHVTKAASDPTEPLTFLLINNDGSDPINLNGQTDGFGIISNPIGYAVTVNYAYNGTDALGRVGDGNDLAITISSLPVPEPGVLTLVAIAFMPMYIVPRRRLLNVGNRAR